MSSQTYKNLTLEETKEYDHLLDKFFYQGISQEEAERIDALTIKHQQE